MASVKEIIDYYDRSANGLYDRWGAGTGAIHFGFYLNPNSISPNLQPEQVELQHRESLLQTTREIIAANCPDQANIVLDMGCGTGHLTFVVAAMGITCLGINISPGQLTTASRLRSSLGLSKAIFIRADFAHTRLPDRVANRAIFLETLCHSPDKLAVLAETGRLLKPGSTVTIADYYAKRPSVSPETENVRVVNTGWKIQIAEITTFLQSLTGRGFTSPNAQEITPHMQPSFNLAAASAAAHEGEATSTEIIQHRQATIEFARLMSQGTLGYYLITATKP